MSDEELIRRLRQCQWLPEFDAEVIREAADRLESSSEALTLHRLVRHIGPVQVSAIRVWDYDKEVRLTIELVDESSERFSVNGTVGVAIQAAAEAITAAEREKER